MSSFFCAPRLATRWSVVLGLACAVLAGCGLVLDARPIDAAVPPDARGMDAPPADALADEDALAREDAPAMGEDAHPSSDDAHVPPLDALGMDAPMAVAEAGAAEAGVIADTGTDARLPTDASTPTDAREAGIVDAPTDAREAGVVDAGRDAGVRDAATSDASLCPAMCLPLHMTLPDGSSSCQRTSCVMGACLPFGPTLGCPPSGCARPCEVVGSSLSCVREGTGCARSTDACDNDGQCASGSYCWFASGCAVGMCLPTCTAGLMTTITLRDGRTITLSCDGGRAAPTDVSFAPPWCG